MSTAIIIFAKAPQAGLAKTRLVPALGLQGAARLAEKMLFHAVHQAINACFEHTELCVTPDTQHNAFQTLARQHGKRLRLTRQQEGDLGQRMYGALTDALQTHDYVLLVGTDAPALTTDLLLQARDTLNSKDACFVPAIDGGYTLAGFKQACPALFHNMPWSTPDVMHITRQRLLATGCTWGEQPAINDIDEARDLPHVPAEWLA
ncbi:MULTISPECIES: TIGR04282 family arsenosugar biosynthesis glycosyltransferase [Alcaligenaceae]|uniref:TIGR04282 family arsenosugar biosynthesis glycosyltransferase n=1 Tax=Alcaligenaceae TaxID=506 RepID=UPI0022B4BBFD|nr:TIGR04282 family arsenosugar biosynthesis glycosyltransferase [Castellaniella sp. S9]